MCKKIACWFSYRTLSAFINLTRTEYHIPIKIIVHSSHRLFFSWQKCKYSFRLPKILGGFGFLLTIFWLPNLITNCNRRGKKIRPATVFTLEHFERTPCVCVCVSRSRVQSLCHYRFRTIIASRHHCTVSVQSVATKCLCIFYHNTSHSLCPHKAFSY